MIYLDNAATTFPKPEIVYKTMDTFYRTLGANPGRPGHRMAVAAEKEIEDARNVVSRLFGIGDAKRLILTFNATDAINMGIKGLLKQGDLRHAPSFGPCLNWQIGVTCSLGCLLPLRWRFRSYPETAKPRKHSWFDSN